MEVEHRTIQVNGVRLHVALAGPVEGPLALLLHGFPEYWRALAPQMEALAAAGYRVAAPDQRGYNLSEKPGGVAAYGLETLRDDALGLIEALGRAEAFVVGHDWGAAVAWWLCTTHPSKVRRAVTMNVPHPQVMFEHLMKSPRQMLRSWYIFFFQIPRLPEWFLGREEGRVFAQALRATGRRGTFSEEELEGLREAWRQPGALRGMLGWYRAALRHRPRFASARVEAPMLLIWGERDSALGVEMAAPSVAMCVEGRLERIAEATHWVAREEAARVNALILEWFSAPSPGRGFHPGHPLHAVEGGVGVDAT
jgi:pimeloyl-ACP methyl ester carboxylesterase